LATDFFTVDLLDGTTAYVLAVIEHATQRVRILGITPHPAGAWVTQQARNPLMELDGQAATIKFLIRDRDTKFTAAFDEVLHAVHIRTLNSPVQAPRANAIMERWIGGCRRELLDRTLIWDQRHLLAGAARVREPPQRTPSAPLARTGRTTQAAACRPR
jgi:hypothetical protein